MTFPTMYSMKINGTVGRTRVKWMFHLTVLWLSEIITPLVIVYLSYVMN